jgi:3-methyladenine DNA glycosylase AlkD
MLTKKNISPIEQERTEKKENISISKTTVENIKKNIQEAKEATVELFIELGRNVYLFACNSLIKNLRHNNFKTIKDSIISLSIISYV